jgi:aryl-phospho-beta-D-glucosidase BglC (GH1 family)
VKFAAGIIAGMLSLLTVHGTTVYQCEFKPDQLKDWNIPSSATIETINGNPILSMTVSPEDGGGKQNFATRKFDLTPYRNKILFLSCKIKAGQVTVPKQSWNGVKFMVNFHTGGLETWQHINNVWGTFDWKEYSFSFPVPNDARSGTLSLGLQDCSGTVKFSDLKVMTADLQSLYPVPPVPENFKAEYTGRVSGMPRLRGVMSPPQYRRSDLEDLAQWGANLIRWQLVRAWGKAGTDRDQAEYSKWIDSKIAELDQLLADAGRLGIKVVIDLHSPPGGRYENRSMAMLYEEKYAQQFIEIWERIAKKFKGHEAVWGYDLINEPVQGMPALYDYLTIQIMAANAIRKIDPDVPVIIESNEWDSPASYKYLGPLPMKDVIYQVHMYVPGEFTHQGVNNNWGETSKGKLITYPGLISGSEYNRETLRKVLQPVIDFQKKYGARIYVGEFSAIRWAPGAAQYLDDCISIFEEHDWNWTYHAYREWTGWSVEYSNVWNDNTPSTRDTDRKKVLLKWFEKNQKPSDSKK